MDATTTTSQELTMQDILATLIWDVERPDLED